MLKIDFCRISIERYPVFGSYNRKYKLTRVGKLSNPVKDLHPHSMFRLVALRDIHAHGVKRGDLGGFVYDASTLSHEGSCWVGGQAQAIYNVRISDNVLIDGDAVVDGEDDCPIYVRDNVRITGNAQVLGRKETLRDSHFYHGSTIKDSVRIDEYAFVRNLNLGSGNAVITGKAQVLEAEEICGFSHVSGQAVVNYGAMLSGESVIGAYDIIKEKSVIRNGVLLENSITYSTVPTPKKVPEKKSGSPNDVTSKHGILDVFTDVMASINTYQEDIVKIIKYPVMTDRTDSFTLKMAKAINHAKRLSANPDSSEFKDAVSALEDAFLEAESNAVKLAATTLSEAERKKTELAQDLLRVAADESATENEKKVAFKQGFKTLEGVLTVPEGAVDAFRVKVGLKEIEV